MSSRSLLLLLSLSLGCVFTSRPQLPVGDDAATSDYDAAQPAADAAPRDASVSDSVVDVPVPDVPVATPDAGVADNGEFSDAGVPLDAPVSDCRAVPVDGGDGGDGEVRFVDSAGNPCTPPAGDASVGDATADAPTDGTTDSTTDASADATLDATVDASSDSAGTAG